MKICLGRSQAQGPFRISLRRCRANQRAFRGGVDRFFRARTGAASLSSASGVPGSGGDPPPPTALRMLNFQELLLKLSA
jgi:hypothetical protein